MATPTQDAPLSKPSSLTNTQGDGGIFANADYKPETTLTNWFTAKPYGFRFSGKDGRDITMFLPISPSNLTITTNFATNVTPTLYGTVEEHSPVRYYDITIEGNTGMGPKYVSPAECGLPLPATQRSTFTIQQTLKSTDLGGFFAKTLNSVNNVIDGAKSLFGLTPVAPTGIFVDQNGYIAFHNLYRFLLQYKKDVSGVNPATKNKPITKHPLTFFNYKDANEYKVIVRSMTLRRDKEDPMLYFYSISMRGYDLRSISNSSVDNRTADERLEQTLKDLGLNGVIGSTFLGDAKKFAADAKGVLGSVATGINQFGR